MTSAHIFYIPILLFIGLIAGYFLGQRATEKQIEERRKKLQRRRAMQKRAEQQQAENAGES